MSKLTLGQKIKKARLEKKLTQKELVGNFITRNMLSAIENDISKPSIKTLEYLAKRLDKPITYFLESLVNINCKEKDNLELAFEHSSYLFKNEQYSNCISYIESIIKNYTSDSNNNYYGRILYILGNCYLKTSKLNLAEKTTLDCLEILENTNDYYYLAHSYLNLGYINFNNKNYLLAKDYIKNSLDSFKKSYVEDILLEIKIYYQLGYSLYKLSSYSAAIPYLTYALDISRKYNCQYNVGIIHMLLGNIYDEQNNFEKSIYHTKKAEIFFDFSEEYNLKASCQKNLGIFHLKNNDFETAKSYFYKSLEYFKKIDDLRQINTLKIGITETLVKKGSFLEAIKYAKNINTEVVHISDKIDLYKSLGKAYISIKELEKAKNYLFEAEKLGTENKKHNKLYEIYINLSQVYSLEENYKEAYKYLSHANKKSN